jgi:chromosome segregation ATPase
MQTFTPRASVAGLMLALCAAAAQAQTAANAPAGKVQSLGNASATASVMSRDELRACLRDQDALKATAASLADRRVALNAEQKALESENDGLKKERDAMAAKIEASAQAINAKVAAQAASVNAYNEKMDAMNAAAKKGENVDRRRQLLERDGKALQAASDSLNESVKAAQTENEATEKSLNERFAAFEGRIANWNTRNKQINPDADAYDEKLQSWKLRCGTRNYRESDEKAIRDGR